MNQKFTRVAIVGEAQSWHVCDLQRAAAELSVDCDLLSFDQLSAAVALPARGGQRVWRSQEGDFNGSDTSFDNPKAASPKVASPKGASPKGAGDRAGDINAGNLASAAYDAILVRGMPRGSLQQVIFRMSVLGETARRGGTVINSPQSLEIAIDKYLCLSRLEHAGLLVPPTIVCQSMQEAHDAMSRLGGDAVLKPIFGSQGRGIERVRSAAELKRTASRLLQTEGVLYLQQFVPKCEFDLRLFVVGEVVIGMRRSNPGDWRHNVTLGAHVTSWQVERPLADLALRAVRTIGASVAGVDLLLPPDAPPRILEVNAVPGWRALQSTTDADLAKMIVHLTLVGPRPF